MRAINFRIAALGLTCLGCNLVLGTEEGVLSGGAGTGAGPTSGGGGEGSGAGPSGGSGGEGGAAAECDLPSDCPDLADCFDPDCVGGACTSVPSPQGTACGPAGDLTCDGDGACAGCTVDGDCGVDTPCASFECAGGGVCETTYFDGLVLANPVLGDCTVTGCVAGSSEPVEVADDSDLPVDGDVCTSDVCSAGVPSNPLEPEGTPCDQGVCLGDGTCGCNDIGDCFNSPAGPACLGAGVCGCMSNFQCQASPWGEECLGMTDACGCNGQGDCESGQSCDKVLRRCVDP